MAKDWNTAAIAELAAAFGDEFAMLASSLDSTNVLHDFILAKREDGCTGSQYRDRIGRGNLASYAKTIRGKS